MSDKKMVDLPQSNDDIWEGAEKYITKPVTYHICQSHHKNWQKHQGYLDNKDGTASCMYCPWGFRLPGYMRILNGKVFDLRKK